MQRIVILALLAIAISAGMVFVFPGPRVNANTIPTPVVVELFTSEGCSSCPPADKLLGQLQRQQKLENAELILLGEHVDYWNGLGWKDRFSSPTFTERQRQYVGSMNLQSAYTPQAVVDGHIDVVGNDERGLEKAILRSASTPKLGVVSLQWTAPGLLHVRVTNSQNAQVLLAITEDDLSTQVGGGENGGRVLRHAAVVRELRRLATTKQGSYEGDVKVAWQPEWKPDNLRAIVLVQLGNGQVLGAASLKR